MMRRTNSWAERQTPLTNPQKMELGVALDPDYAKKIKRSEESRMWKSIREYFREYSENSSLHGIRYMGEKGRSIVERIWWLLIFAMSIYMCLHLILKTWVKWDLSPVIVSFAESPTPIWKIPFPAVTICSETKARQSAFNFTKAYHQWIEGEERTEEEIKNFADISLLCDSHLYTHGNKTTDQSTINFMHAVAPNFTNMFMACKWAGLNEDCSSLFSPTLTEEGICYTFNMLDSSELFTKKVESSDYLRHGKTGEWSLHEGYIPTKNMSVYPRRALGAGLKAGLTILYTAYDYDLDYICKGPVQGFKILLHNPAETPRVSQQYFRAPLNQEVIVAIKPGMMTTSEGLKTYNPARRHCYFQSEKLLSLYNIYTQQNCQVECLTNYTLQKCGCVSYHMPHAAGTPVCGSGSANCTVQANTELLLYEVASEIAETDGHENLDKRIKCNCLPACTSLHYSAETSQADFDWIKLFQAFKADFDEFPGIVMGRVNIFFKDTQFITSRRSELYGQTDFLANCGGLLGLFMGFSFISLIEIVYFLTLRMWCNIRIYGRKMWNAPKAMTSRVPSPMMMRN